MLETMPTKVATFVLIVLVSGNTGCATTEDVGDRVDEAWVTAVIMGSAESPDPVLVWVEHLEREGKVRDVAVMESYPVQIRLTGPRHIIEELKVAKRKLPPESM